MEWIKLKNEQPKEDEMVLVWTGYPTEPYLIASYDPVLKYWIDYNEQLYNDEGTYWKRLPNPPKDNDRSSH